jgi:hypothetical protein
MLDWPNLTTLGTTYRRNLATTYLLPSTLNLLMNLPRTWHK